MDGTEDSRRSAPSRTPSSSLRPGWHRRRHMRHCVRLRRHAPPFVTGGPSMAKIMRSNNGLRFQRNRKFVDSPLEGTGFEPSVPLLRKALPGLPIGDGVMKGGATYRFTSETVPDRGGRSNRHVPRRACRRRIVSRRRWVVGAVAGLPHQLLGFGAVPGNVGAIARQCPQLIALSSGHVLTSR